MTHDGVPFAALRWQQRMIRQGIKFCGCLLVGCGALLMVALASYSSNDPSWNAVSVGCQHLDEFVLSKVLVPETSLAAAVVDRSSTISEPDGQHPKAANSRLCQPDPDDDVRNLLFHPGAYSADLLFQLFGIVGWLCPLGLVFFGLRIVFRPNHHGRPRDGASLLCVAGLLGMLVLQSMVPFWNSQGVSDYPVGGSVGVLMIDTLSVIPFIGQRPVAVAALAWSGLLLVLFGQAWTVLVRYRATFAARPFLLDRPLR